MKINGKQRVKIGFHGVFPEKPPQPLFSCFFSLSRGFTVENYQNIYITLKYYIY